MSRTLRPCVAASRSTFEPARRCDGATARGRGYAAPRSDLRVRFESLSRQLGRSDIVRTEEAEGRDPLARDDLIQATGTVEKILGGGRYRIVLEAGQTVTAQLSGRMRRFRIRVIPGDRVQVGVSPYDPTHGFITFRLREGQNAPR